MSRLVPIAASVAIHVIILVGTALVIAGAAAPHGQVIFFELTEAAAPPRPVSSPRAVPSPPRPELATAAPVKPVVPEPAAPQVGATLPEAPPALATVPAPTPSVPPTASAPHASTALTPRGEAAPAPSTLPMVAALPRDGITQRAIPRASYQYRPAYPASAWRRGIGGTTLLAVLVADDGRVAEIVIKESAGDPELDRAAADAVGRWRFEPARRGTEPVAMWVELPVKFRIP